LLLAASLMSTVWCGVWEYSVRKYLQGFSDAIVADTATPQQKAEAILDWMRVGPPRMNAPHVEQLSARDPQDTLNYQQLLQVCGSATNAFLNLSRSAGVEARRLLLLSPEHTAKHVVAEVHLDGRWVIVDATYRAFMRDAKGNLLTRQDLQKPEVFREATSRIPNYIQEYSYENSAHVRLAALPFHGFHVRQFLEGFFPAWDDFFDWSLLLERRSFFYLFVSVISFLALLVLRSALAWLADNRLRIPRFHLRANLVRATSTFFTTPEIK
jgi:transglutaminase-like putative cysteine protease